MNIEHIISNNFSNSDPVIEGWITSFCWQRGILIAATTAFSLAAAGIVISVIEAILNL